MSKVRLTTSMGPIVIELDEAKSPISAANFLSYVDSGHYDGTIFHRVIDGFMVQGGGFSQDMRQKPVQAPIKNESTNGVKNLNYTLAMARTNVRDSATSQFFINVKDNAFLDYSGESIIPHPGFEQVAQDIQRIGARDDLRHETFEPLDDSRAGLVEVQVRDEKLAAQARSAFWITTASFGTSWCPPVVAVATLRILSTVSWPSTTLPNTA